MPEREAVRMNPFAARPACEIAFAPLASGVQSARGMVRTCTRGGGSRYSQAEAQTVPPKVVKDVCSVVFLNYDTPARTQDRADHHGVGITEPVEHGRHGVCELGSRNARPSRPSR